MAFTTVLGTIVALAFVFHCIIGEGISDGKLKQQREKPVTTIKTEYGDIYDCVDIDKQPALKHPSLVHHMIQMQPSKQVQDILAQRQSTEKTSSMGYISHQKIGLKKGCPVGTVPIRRMTTQRQGTQIRTGAQRGLHFGLEDQINGDGTVEFAGIYTTPGSYRGAAGMLSVHKPRIDPNSKKYSSALIEIASGDPQNLNRIRVGWTVNPALYHDNNVRLFTQWEDLAANAGCYNVMCPGFVLLNQSIPLDSVLTPSKFNDPNIIYLSQLNVIQDPEDKNWWLFILVRDLRQQIIYKITVGYWPASLFTSLQLRADYLRWGGEVFTPANDDSSPEMGSGYFENMIYERTASFRTLTVVRDQSDTIIPHTSFIKKAESRCYLEGDNSDEYGGNYTSFTYGGTGGTHDDCF